VLTVSQRDLTIGIALIVAFLAALLAVAQAPAAANTPGATCVQEGLYIRITVDQGIPTRRFSLFEGATDDPARRWLRTSTADGFEISENDAFDTFSVRYVTIDDDGSDLRVDLDCQSDPDPIDPEPDPNLPDPNFTPDCFLSGSNLRWDRDVGDGLVDNAWNVREVRDNGSTVWRATVFSGFWFAGQSTGEFIVRYRYQGPSGVITVHEFPCTSPGDELALQCSQVGGTLTWNDVPHVNADYSIREVLPNGSTRWVDTLRDLTAQVDPDGDYLIRIFVLDDGGTTPVDAACS